MQDAGSSKTGAFPCHGVQSEKPVRTVLFTRKTGKENLNAYQEEVFAEIEKQSYLMDTKLAKYPFKTSDFQYDRTERTRTSLKILNTH